MSISLSSIINIIINLANPGLSRPGFGKPMILSNTGNAWATPELTREYTRGSFATDFPSTTVEFAMLTAIFSQPRPPTSVLVGKGVNKPTKINTILIQTATNGATYKIKVVNGGTAWDATYVAGADTTTQIATALVALLTPAAWQLSHAYTVGQRATNDTGKAYEVITAGTSAGSGGPTGTSADITDGTVHWKYISTPNFTAANSASATITATGNAAGNWFALEPIASGDPAAVSNLMRLTDTTTDPSGNVSGDLTTILGANSDWYALLLAFKSSAILATTSTGVSAWCESNERLLVATVSDTICATAAFSGATDVLHTLTGQGASYTAAQFHPRDYEFLDACTDGYFLSIDPGGDNWTRKGLVGPTPVNYTPTQIINVEARRAGYFATLGSQNVLGGAGQVESTLYGFIDTRRNIDWYRANLQIDLVNLLIASNKLPNTDAGRRKIASKIAARNDIGIQQGVISPDPFDPTNPLAPIMEPYTVTVPPVSDESSFDPTTRALTGCSTAFKLADPINSVAVTVNITQ